MNEDREKLLRLWREALESIVAETHGRRDFFGRRINAIAFNALRSEKSP
jgi:hypothetical protein